MGEDGARDKFSRVFFFFFLVISSGTNLLLACVAQPAKEQNVQKANTD